MRYILLSDNRPEELVSQVADRLNAGWQLQGGICVAAMDDANYPRGTLLYSQAMTLPPVP